jgi:PKD repeat protein
MTNQNDNKKQHVTDNSSEKELVTNNTPPVTIDVGDAADPFERLQTQKVAIIPWSTPQEKSEQVQAVVKRWSKISPKIFLIGCGGLFIIFLLLVFLGLYYVGQSWELLQSIGLDIEDVKSILIIFAVLFFGIIFFIGFYLLVLNIYRLVTVKSRKLPYVLGLIWWLLIIITTIIAGTLSISQIRAMGSRARVITDMLVLPYVETKDAPVRVNDGIPVVAPLKMRYQLNKTQVERNILPSLGGSAQLSSFEVDCGNGQILSATQQIYLGQTNNFFPWSCLYLNKGSYPISLKVNYLDRTSGESLSRSFTVGDLAIGAEIRMEPIDDTASLNDKLTEYIIGTSPVTVRFRGQLLFTDLGLTDDRIEWDFDADGQPDIIDNTAFEYPFGYSKLYPIYYRLPGVGKYANTWLNFDLRVLESELAQCDLEIEAIDNDKQYKRTAKFNEMINVASYQYTIVDTNRDTVVEKFKESKNEFSYTFAQGGRYEIQTSYFTPDGQKWSCYSEPIIVGFNGNQVSFDLRWSQDEQTPFVKVGEETPVNLDVVSNKLSVNLLPAILEFSITGVQPDPTAKVQLEYDGRQVFEDRPKVFEVPITNLGTKELKFIVTTAQGNVSEQIYEVEISRQPVKALINASPTVGEDPLEVVLDASISPLYDENDEIVYFTWDFGDGQTKENISQGKITHTYRYDTAKENGEFFPSVTVKTRLWFTDTYRLPTAISVKKQQKTAVVNVDSHPTQQVRVGEIVQFRVETDGAVEHIDWNFGNGQVLGCDDRSCSSASSVYDTPGEYSIVSEIQYSNDVPVSARTNIKVY